MAITNFCCRDKEPQKNSPIHRADAIDSIRGDKAHEMVSKHVRFSVFGRRRQNDALLEGKLMQFYSDSDLSDLSDLFRSDSSGDCWLSGFARPKMMCLVQLKYCHSSLWLVIARQVLCTLKVLLRSSTSFRFYKKLLTLNASAQISVKLQVISIVRTENILNFPAGFHDQT